MDEQVFHLFSSKLSVMLTLEKKINKLYLKFIKAALAPELAKALSPEETWAEQHVQRLMLIRQSAKLLKANPEQKNLTVDFNLRLKKANRLQDLDIIAKALELQNLKLAGYEFIHPFAIKLGFHQVAELLEQTITDDRNTNTWLRQLIQNVVLASGD